MTEETRGTSGDETIVSEFPEIWDEETEAWYRAEEVDGKWQMSESGKHKKENDFVTLRERSRSSTPIVRHAPIRIPRTGGFH